MLILLFPTSFFLHKSWTCCPQVRKREPWALYTFFFEELAKVKGKTSLLAAVDYYLSMHSDIFISASPGNMHNALAGHRAYMNLKTIKPNMALLGQLFQNKCMSWSEFQRAVLDGDKNRQGQIRLKKGEAVNLYISCSCLYV